MVTNTTMSALLLSVLGISAALQHCPAWKEIAPCTCRIDASKVINIDCEKMASFDQVVNLLSGHFGPSDRVWLRIGSSNIGDLQYRTFKEFNMTIENLKLNYDYLGSIRWETFEGLNHVTYFSLADSGPIDNVPDFLWSSMPEIKTLDLGRTKIEHIYEKSFKDLAQLECLVLAGNLISIIDTNAIPRRVDKLHLGRNNLKHMNDSLKELSRLRWLFVNANELSNLEGQLPIHAPDFSLIHAANNKLTKLPQQLKGYDDMESVFFQNNELRSLDGALHKLKKLHRINLENNHINTITEDDFYGLENLESLLLGNNEITTLNNSLTTLKSLNYLNISYNYLTEFSFQDLVGLPELRSIDASYNRISRLTGPAPNLVDWNIKLTELKLDHNHLEMLNGALSGLPELLRLNLSFNKLKRISPDDFIGLDQLRLLDISHNHLMTLEETSKTFLPRLSELRASHNFLTVLERDFHGLPVLCHADLSNNQIVALGKDLVSKTRCKIEHGVHEGTWDTLKIYLQDNPILCDAALPEIMSYMEVNHTRIYGVSHCPPLSEQPVTSKPNGFLGYLPSAGTTPPLPAAISANQREIIENTATAYQNVHKTSADNQVQQSNFPEASREPPINLRPSDQYTIENDQPVTDQPIAVTIQQKVGDEKLSENLENKTQVFDPITQGRQITKLASEIEQLRTRIDQLSTQNELLLNKTLLEQKSVPEEARKP